MAAQATLAAAAIMLAAASLVNACARVAPIAPTVQCADLPDAAQALAQAWQAYQPDQPMVFSVNVRRRLFVFQALLLSSGMYDEPPADPASVYEQYALQFVRDFGMSRNPAMADALQKLKRTLEQVRDRGETELGRNCGLIHARRMLRTQPVDVSTDWVLQTVTWGFAPMFQTSIRQMILEHARGCASDAETANASESVLACTMRRVGLEAEQHS